MTAASSESFTATFKYFDKDDRVTSLWNFVTCAGPLKRICTTDLEHASTLWEPNFTLSIPVSIFPSVTNSPLAPLQNACLIYASNREAQTSSSHCSAAIHNCKNAWVILE